MKRLGAICICLSVLIGACGAEGARAFTAHVRFVPLPHDTHIAWYERGHGPPLLMLTGTGSTMSEWDPALLRPLARRHRLVLFDYPGVGMSGPWRGHRSFDGLADVAGDSPCRPWPRPAPATRSCRR